MKASLPGSNRLPSGISCTGLQKLDLLGPAPQTALLVFYKHTALNILAVPSTSW